MLGEPSASIAHEVHQPPAAIVLAEGALRFLDQKATKLDEARQATSRIVQSAEHASNVTRRI
jgi:two-component system sensor kinase FixL